jgi:hypothetical protein
MAIEGQITSQRRVLHFDSLDQITTDANALAAAEKAGKLRKLGNWSLGQCCGHLAAWIDFSFDGIPIQLPWIAKFVLRRMKTRFLNQPMRPGGKIPRVPGGTLATEPLPIEQGLQKLHRACTRLKKTAPTRPHPIFGPMTHEEWKKLTLRHAELHLSFLRAD